MEKKLYISKEYNPRSRPNCTYAPFAFAASNPSLEWMKPAPKGFVIPSSASKLEGGKIERWGWL